MRSSRSPRLWSSRLAWSAFETVFQPWMDRRVRVHLSLRYAPIEPEFPLVLVANHESWWDGFLLRRVQKALRPRARYHAVMLERELRPRPYLRLLGGIGVEPGSLSSARGLLGTLERLRLEDPTGVLSYFPQGVIRPGGPRPLGFRGGIQRVVEAVAPATVLPVGIRVMPGVSHHQDAFVSVGEPLAAPTGALLSLSLLEDTVAEELDAIQAFVDAWGEQAAARWPRAPHRLPRASRIPNAPGLLHEVENWISRN